MEENYDKSLLFKVPYGVYLVTSADENEKCGCIINTFSQMADGPAKGVISINKKSKTAELIVKMKKFNVSFLTENIDLEIVSHFGLKSGNDIDKFSDEYAGKLFDFKTIEYGIPRINQGVVGDVLCNVMQVIDLDTHYLFVFDIENILYNQKEEKVLTYEEYRKRKKKDDRPDYVCSVCHYVYDGEEDFENLPDDYVCPVCGMPKSVFYKVEK